MSLTDLMSAARLDAYPQIALIAFIVAFLIIVARLFSRRNAATYDRARMMPLDDDTPQTPRSDRGQP
jgi:cbb3-type cytochrome oxidase subunit 3